MSGKRSIAFLVAVKRGQPFAVVIYDGDDSTTELTGFELPGPMSLEQAAAYASGRHGLDPAALHADGVEGQIIARPVGAETTYEEFCDDCRDRMSQIAPELSAPGGAA
jgi:hypothetical protein